MLSHLSIQVAKNRVSTFSGGMKRRLSVALCFLGDPRIVFLGMKYDSNCVVILIMCVILIMILFP